MKNTFIKLARALLCVICFAAVLAASAAAVIGGAVKFYLSDADFYVERIVTDEYLDSVYNVAQSRIKIACGKLGFNYDSVSGCVERDALEDLSREYVRGLVDSIKSGEANEEVTFSDDAFLPAINEYADAHKSEINEAYQNADVRKSLASELSKSVTRTLNSFSGQTITKNLHSILFGNEYIELIVKLFWPAVAALVVFGALMTAFGMRGGKGAYLASLAAYIGTLLCFLPINRLYNFDMSKLILGGSSLAFVVSAWKGILGFLNNYILITVIAAAILLVVSIVLINLPRKKKAVFPVPAEPVPDGKPDVSAPQKTDVSANEGE